MYVSGMQNNNRPESKDDFKPLDEKAIEGIIKEDKESESKGADGKLAAIRRRLEKNDAKASKSEAVSTLEKQSDLTTIHEQFGEKRLERALKKFEKVDMERRETELTEFAKELKTQFSAQQSSYDKVVLTSLSSKKTQKEEEKQSEGLPRAVRREQETSQTPTTAQLKKDQIKTEKEHSKLIKEIPEKELKNYVMLVADELIKPSPKKKEELKKIQTELQEKGLTSKQLKQVEVQVSQFVVKDMTKELKRQYIKVAGEIAKSSKSAGVIREAELYKGLLEKAQELGVIDSEKDKKEVVQEAVNEELRGFVAGELDRRLTEVLTKSLSIADLSKSFDELNSMSNIARFDSSEYIKHVQKKIDNLGLNFFVNPNPNPGVLDDQDRRQKKKKRDQVEAIQSEEGIEESIRKLYEKMLLGGVLESVKARWSLSSEKDKLNPQNREETLKTLREQSIGFMKLRLIMRLRALFEERATIADLKSDAHKRVKKEIKRVLKQLKKIGHELEKSEIIALRDQANRGMFTILKEEFIRLGIETNRYPNNPRLKEQYTNCINVLNRLKSESHIIEEIKPSMMKGLEFLSDVNIIEAA